MKTKSNKEAKTQVYDKHRDYIKIVPKLFGHSEIVVATDRAGEPELHIKTNFAPHKVLLNGEEL